MSAEHLNAATQYNVPMSNQKVFFSTPPRGLLQSTLSMIQKIHFSLSLALLELNETPPRKEFASGHFMQPF